MGKAKRPCHSYVAEVLDIVSLHEADPAFAVAKYRDVGMKSAVHQRPFLPDMDDEHFIWSEPCSTRGEHRGSVKEVLQQWYQECSLENRGRLVPCISFVEPVLQLIARSDWRHVVLGSRMPGWREHVDPWFPFEFAQLVRNVGIYKVDVSMAELSPEFLWEHIAFLKQHAPAIIQHDGDCRQELEEHVQRFETIPIAISGGPDVVATLYGGAGSWKMISLLSLEIHVSQLMAGRRL